MELKQGDEMWSGLLWLRLGTVNFSGRTLCCRTLFEPLIDDRGSIRGRDVDLILDAGVQPPVLPDARFFEINKTHSTYILRMQALSVTLQLHAFLTYCLFKHSDGGSSSCMKCGEFVSQLSDCQLFPRIILYGIGLNSVEGNLHV
jgi:hypothetical protein